MDYDHYKRPEEGDVREDKGKKFIWTKRAESNTCFIFEWVEDKPKYEFNYTDYDYTNYV